MAINASIADYHLILNPDAIPDVNALTQGIQYLTANPDVELVAPAVLTPSGEQHHLCRRYPSLFNLFLRGFMPRSITTMFNNRLAHFEYRELSPEEPRWENHPGERLLYAVPYQCTATHPWILGEVLSVF